MSQKSSVSQAVGFVSQVLKRDTQDLLPTSEAPHARSFLLAG